MPDNLINEAVNKSLDMVAEQLFFRKLGVCYDFRCGASGFPSPHLPSSAEISKNQPDASGSHTGMYDCMFNNVFLFEALALRFEIGIARECEDRILDRLIGGAIRLATIGPKAGIIRGLSPDGRSFYPDSGDEAFMLWAYYAWRICTSPAVAPESQGKLRNIASRWVGSLSAADFIPPASEVELGSGNWYSALYLPALLATTGEITSEEKWKKLALEKLPQSLPAAEDKVCSRDLFCAMLSVHMLCNIFPEAKELESVRQWGNVLASTAQGMLEQWSSNPCADGAELAELDWHKHGVDSEDQSGWERLEKEQQTLVTSIEAACALLFCPDTTVVTEYAGKIEKMLREVQWDGCWLAESMILAAVVHARGVERELWDKEISEYQITFDTSATLVEKFMAEEYDELHPQFAGHTEKPKPSEKPEKVERRSSQRSRRSSKKSGGSQKQPPKEQNADSAENKPENAKRPPRKRRRRRKKKPQS